MKLARVVDDRFHEALKKLASKPLPLRVTFKLKGVTQVVRDEFAKYEDVRKEAITKYAIKNEDGSIKLDERQNAQFDEAGVQSFSKDLNELLALDVAMPTVKVSELGDITLSLFELELLDGVIEED